MPEDVEECVGGNGVDEDCKQIHAIAKEKGCPAFLIVLAQSAIHEAYINIRTIFKGVHAYEKKE